MSWVRVATLSELPDDSIVRVNAGRFDVLVVRGTENYLVIPPSCPHMSAELADGFFDGCILTCSKHLWQWSVTDGGAAIGPAESGLLTYETKEEDGVLYANLDRELLYEHEYEQDA